VIGLDLISAYRPRQNRDAVQPTIDLQHRQQTTSPFIVDPHEKND
jgi:hypothetical protein